MTGQYSPPEEPTPPESVSTTQDEMDDDPNSAEPYAKLIFRALISAPNYSMVLKDIYEWFAKNTNKSSDSSSEGWKNSIRHNLSMNAVCSSLNGYHHMR
jgi:hypothetical protein